MTSSTAFQKDFSFYFLEWGNNLQIKQPTCLKQAGLHPASQKSCPVLLISNLSSDPRLSIILMGKLLPPRGKNFHLA